MNNRLTIQDLAGLLAERTGKDRKNTELFLREFISVISEGVYTDKIVKVKGLGTFKVILVEKRESIHVNTGERFLIPEHYKFSFLPDKELREMVNKPFSFFETTELNENVDFSDIDELEEEKDSEDESIEEVMPDKEIPVIDEQPEPVEDMPLSEPEPIDEEQVAEEPVKESEPEEDIQAVQPPVQEEFIPEPKPVSPRESLFDQEYRTDSSGHSSMKKMLVFVLVLALISIVGFYAYWGLQGLNSFKHVDGVASLDIVSTENPEAISDSLYMEDMTEEEDTITEVVLVQEDMANVSKTPTVEKPVPVSPVAKEAKVKQAATSGNDLAKVKIEPGSRLTLIALEYYGSKIFWVYLYEYNKAVIKDPNNVAIGTEISVPAPGVYGIDVHDKASVAKAAARQTEILAGKL